MAIVLHQLYRGASGVIYSVKLNKLIGSEVRASIASLLSSSIMALTFLLMVMINIFSLSSILIHRTNFLLEIVLAIMIGILHFTRSSKIDDTEDPLLNVEPIQINN